MKYRIGNDLPIEFIKYLSDFNKLCSIVINTLADKDCCERDTYLSQIVSEFNIDHFIEPDDIVQEIALIWIKSIKNYKETQPDISLRQYLIRMTVWGVRDWLSKEAHIYMKDIITRTSEEKEELSFNIDLSFLLYGSQHPSLQSLTSYQRYLFYLSFKEDKSILQIAKHLQKDRWIVGIQFSKALERVRSLLNNENTNRFSK